MALTAVLQHPSRFSFIQRVTRDDPQLTQLIPVLASTPGCRSLRISVLTEDERVRFAAGEWDQVMQLAQQYELPLSVMIQDAGTFLPRVARQFDSLKLIVDHCGWVRTPEQWQQVLELARLPNTYLKWSHARRCFRRHTEPEVAMQREFVRAVEAYGASRMLWASDASYEESGATWSELLSFVRDNPALSDGDRAWILGGTARKIFRWKA
jgi:predicted TIM-barrel fold metal-dependent hydrolase